MTQVLSDTNYLAQATWRPLRRFSLLTVKFLLLASTERSEKTEKAIKRKISKEKQSDF